MLFLVSLAFVAEINPYSFFKFYYSGIIYDYKLKPLNLDVMLATKCTTTIA